MSNIKINNKFYTLNVTSEYGSVVVDPNINLINFYLKELQIPIGTIVDIGANQGVISILLKDNIINNGIVCIEPADENVERIKHNVPDAIIYHMAVSNINFTGSLRNNGGNQCYMVDTTKFGNTLISTLDSLDIKDVMLIKIDVETHELEVLEGSINTIKKYNPIIYLEHHPEVDKSILFNLIESFNYKIIFTTEYVVNEINTYILIPNK